MTPQIDDFAVFSQVDKRPEIILLEKKKRKRTVKVIHFLVVLSLLMTISLLVSISELPLLYFFKILENAVPFLATSYLLSFIIAGLMNMILRFNMWNSFLIVASFFIVLIDLFYLIKVLPHIG